MLDPLKQSAESAQSSQKIDAARDLDELARLAVGQVCALYRCDAALLLSQPKPGEAICWAASPGSLPELTIPGLPARIDESTLSGRAFKSGKVVSLAEPGFGSNGLARPHTIIAVPLKADDTMVGVLQLSGRFLNASDESTLLALQAQAGKLANAIRKLQGAPPVQAPADSPPGRDRSTAQPHLNLDQIYQLIYRGVSELMPCDVFFVVLFDEERKMGEFVIRVESGSPLPREQVPLDQGLIGDVYRTRRAMVVADSQQERRFELPRWGGANPVRSLICVPLNYGDKTIGALSAQSYRANAFAAVDLKVLSTFADQAALTIHNARLFAASQRQVDQLAVLNQVTRIVSSTMEIGRLLDLIYDQVRRILPADSYYVALIDEEKHSLSVELLVDEGERFPSTAFPLGNNLASLVVRQRAPLLLTNVAEQAPRLGVEPSRLGKPKPSASWLGVPMMTSGHLLGLLAVGSYQLAAFDEDDQEILQSVAAQSAIAVDNARQHAEVERQARHDSLTGALNHGHFLASLQDQVARARETRTPLALIMLDVDRFKQYNDTFGHLAGDAVLRGIVAGIRANIKSTDLVGRWGGEEFVVALPECNREQARQIAERIRQTLAQMKMEDVKPGPMPVPTISQGIAVFPENAAAAIALVDVADVCLYQAKARGRDQISVAGEG